MTILRMPDPLGDAIKLAVVIEGIKHSSKEVARIVAKQIAEANPRG